MNEQFARTSLLLGENAVEKLLQSHVAVFGIGGVGGYVVEALVRSGVGELTVVDNDTVSLTNINRQIIATHSTIGQPKVDAVKARALDINPNLKLHTRNCFFLPETADQFDFADYDYVVDCVDTVTAKIAIISKARENNVPVISCMGTGNKLDPMGFIVSDIEKTSVCPLARVMRRELKARNIKGVKCVYSKEAPADKVIEEESSSRHAPASIAFVPAAAGLLLAREVILDLTK